MQRSGTGLLGNIKEEFKKETHKAGVVPKDLPLGILRDLIEQTSEEERSEFQSNQRKHRLSK